VLSSWYSTRSIFLLFFFFLLIFPPFTFSCFTDQFFFFLGFSLFTLILLVQLLLCLYLRLTLHLHYVDLLLLAVSTGCILGWLTALVQRSCIVEVLLLFKLLLLLLGLVLKVFLLKSWFSLSNMISQRLFM